MLENDIPRKANSLLLLVMIVFALIGARMLMLTTIFHDHFLALSKKPQYKTILQEAPRAAIKDRSLCPLAINTVQYNVAVVFDQIRSIPRVQIKQTSQGKQKIYLRRLYIEKLAAFLSKKLKIDPVSIEDLIFAKAAIFPSTSFMVKEGIDAQTYYELKSLESFWPGLKMEVAPLRFYPNGKTACNIVGYMGAIHSNEHFRKLKQIKALETFLREFEEGLPTPLPEGFASTKEVWGKLQELQDKSYFIHSKIGKSGIEKQFDLELRGSHGKLNYEVDTKGHIVRYLKDSKEARPGEQVILNISLPLQQYAEQLLTENEELRDKRFRIAGKSHNLVHAPWIKGGAIVVMDPKNGEVLTLASYPRFDPNDFIYSGSDETKAHKTKQIHKWLETEQYIGNIFDGKEPLEREYFNKGFYNDTTYLKWNLFLEMILCKESEVKKSLLSLTNMKQVIYIMKACKTLISLSEDGPLSVILDILYPVDKQYKSHIRVDVVTYEYTQDKLAENASEVFGLKAIIDPYLKDIAYTDDKLLFFDLCHLLIGPKIPSFELTQKLAKVTPSNFRSFCEAYSLMEEYIKPVIQKTFYETDFALWREKKFAQFLKEKREIEKEKKLYERPYTDYLDQKKRELLAEFYDANKWEFYSAFLSLNLEVTQDKAPYRRACIEACQKAVVLHEKIGNLRRYLHCLSSHEAQELLHMLRGYQDLETPLFGHYNLCKNKEQTHKDLARAFYPISGFGYSRSFAYQEAAPQGSVFKIVTAYEAMKQHHKIHPNLNNPMTIIDCSDPSVREKNSQILGYHLDGTKITRSYKGGRLPSSHKKSGKIDLVSAFEFSSNIYFSLLSIDKLKSPQDLAKCSRLMNFGKKTGIDLPGEIPGLLPNDIMDNRTSLYAFAIGQHSLVVSPLQTAVMLSAIAGNGHIFKPQIVKKTIAEKKGKLGLDKDHLFKEYFNLIGINTPFLIDTAKKERVVDEKIRQPHIIRTLDYPKPVKLTILNALHKVINGERGIGKMGAIHALNQSTKDREAFFKIRHNLIGKTATAEILYRPCLDRDFKPIIAKHIWFSAASFKEGSSDFSDPELVVIVYLRFGDFGKEAAPLAAKMIEKYRTLQHIP